MIDNVPQSGLEVAKRAGESVWAIGSKWVWVATGSGQNGLGLKRVWVSKRVRVKTGTGQNGQT